MPTVDEVNSRIHAALCAVVARYRWSGAPRVVYTSGNTTVARIASVEFAVTTVEEDGLPVGVEISHKPDDTGIETRLDATGMTCDEVERAVGLRFEEHLLQLASRGVLPNHHDGPRTPD